MNYNFLKGLTLIDTGGLKTPKSKNPEGLALRVFANGEVYPSQELTNEFNLEYQKKDSEVMGNGIDVIDSKDWALFESYPRMILFGITPKQEAKVDIFGTCRYNEDLTPKSSVITQGTISTTLLDLVISLGYLSGEQKYVDLQIVKETPLTISDGIAFIPKMIERGEKKGEKTYQKRENVTFYPVDTIENLKNNNEETQTVESNTVNELQVTNN